MATEMLLAPAGRLARGALLLLVSALALPAGAATPWGRPSTGSATGG